MRRGSTCIRAWLLPLRRGGERLPRPSAARGLRRVLQSDALDPRRLSAMRRHPLPLVHELPGAWKGEQRATRAAQDWAGGTRWGANSTEDPHEVDEGRGGRNPKLEGGVPRNLAGFCVTELGCNRKPRDPPETTNYGSVASNNTGVTD